MAHSARSFLASLIAVSVAAVCWLSPASSVAQPSAAAADSDGDGVADASDACPNEAGIKSADPKTSGCAEKLDAGAVKKSGEITFSGYQSLQNGRGILFVEMTEPLAVEVRRVGRKTKTKKAKQAKGAAKSQSDAAATSTPAASGPTVIEYRLVGARVPLRNNKNPLLLGEFGSAALSARLVADKKAVRLILVLRGPIVPVYRLVPRGKGAALEIELPSQSAAVAASN